MLAAFANCSCGGGGGVPGGSFGCAKFAALLSALDAADVPPPETRELFRATAACLHVGALEFVETDDGTAAGGVGTSVTADTERSRPVFCLVLPASPRVAAGLTPKKKSALLCNIVCFSTIVLLSKVVMSIFGRMRSCDQSGCRHSHLDNG